MAMPLHLTLTICIKITQILIQLTLSLKSGYLYPISMTNIYRYWYTTIVLTTVG